MPLAAFAKVVMGQSLVAISLFPTDLGWFALTGTGRQVQGLAFGHASKAEARKEMARRFPGEEWSEQDWNPAARKICTDYAAGRPADFSKIDVALAARTEFQRKVLLVVRGLGYGETASYGEVAERAGAPGAARAVGTVMSSNCIPLLIPCHRVTAAGGRLGGYSAPSGLGMKEQLLKMEREGLGLSGERNPGRSISPSSASSRNSQQPAARRASTKLSSKSSASRPK